MTKENLVLALLNEGVEGWMETEVPTFPELPAPSESEMALSAYTIASYCVNCNTFMQLFTGLHIFDFLLRGLQRSNPMIALAMSTLEKIGATLWITVYSPEENSEWAGYTVIGVEASPDVVSVFFTGIEEGSTLEKTGNIFSGKYLTDAGTVSLIITGSDGTNETDPVIRSFQALDFSTAPLDQETIAPGEYDYRLITGAGGMVITQCIIEIDGDPEQAYIMVYDGQKFSKLLTIAAGAHTAKFFFSWYFAGTLKEKMLQISYTVEEE